MSTLLRCDDGEETYDWVIATVVDSDTVVLRYQVTGLEVEGSDTFSDDCLDEWSDSDIKDFAGSYIGVLKADRHLIKLERVQ